MAEDPLQSLHRLCQVSGSLTDADAVLALKLSVLLQDFQRDRCKRFLREHSDAPVLMSYSVDPTSIALSASHSQSHGCATVRRTGKVLQELLMQRLVLKAHGPSQPTPVMEVGYPIPLSEGKTAKHIFSAAKTFVPMAREEQHHGFVVVHLCADGALLSSLEALMVARRNLYFSEDGQQAAEEDLELAAMQDLFLASPCLAHALQNSLKWAVAPLSTEESMKNLHVVIESLRNSFSLLHSHIYAFLSSCVCFRSRPHDQESARALWAAVGVEADAVSDFADIHPLWDGQRLWVSQELEGSEEALPKLSFLLLKAFRWQRFTQSRFLTLGSSTRALIASLLLGLDELVRITRQDPASSDYHLHGYSQLSSECRQLAMVCAFASFPAEAGLELLLTDDRVALHLDSFRAAMSEEMDWLQQLGLDTWTSLSTAASLQEAGPDNLRHAVMQAALTSMGYIHSNALRLFEQEPWIWSQGNLHDHIHTLKTSSTDGFWHPVSQQLATYLGMGGEERNVLAVLELLQQCSFTTMGVEQQHGSYATVHRLHPEYGLQTLSTRGFLHSCRALLQSSQDAAVVDQLQRLETKLEKKQPNKVGGRSMFLQEMLTKSEARDLHNPSSVQGPGHTVFSLQQAVLQSASQAWKSMPHADKARYDQLALRYSQLQIQLLNDQKEELRQRMALALQRQAGSQQSAAMSRNILSCGRFSEIELERFRRVYHKNKHLLLPFQQKHAELQTTPPLPSELEMEMLHKHWPSKSKSTSEAPPPWLRHVAAQRDYFQDTVFMQSTNTGPVAYLLLFVKRSPVQGVVMQVDIAVSQRCCEGSSHSSGPAYPSFSKWTFKPCFPRKFQLLHEGLFTEGALFFVRNVFWEDGLLHSMDSSEELSLWLHSFRVHASKQHQDTEGKAPKLSHTYQPEAEANPWIKDYLSMPPASSRQQSSQNKGTPATSSRAPVSSMDDAEVDGVWEALAARRAAWKESQGVVQEHFSTQIRGGRWTKLNLGTEADCVAAMAAKGAPSAFCIQFSLARMSSYSFAKYGERAALLMAQEWCRRMEHFYQLYLQGDDAFRFDSTALPSYEPSSEWTAFFAELHAGTATFNRAVAIQGLRPVNPDEA